jgi:hypothetical protein
VLTPCVDSAWSSDQFASLIYVPLIGELALIPALVLKERIHKRGALEHSFEL